MIPKRERTLLERLNDRLLRMLHGPRYRDRAWSLHDRRRAQRRRELFQKSVFAAAFLTLGIAIGASLTLVFDRAEAPAQQDAVAALEGPEGAEPSFDQDGGLGETQATLVEEGGSEQAPGEELASARKPEEAAADDPLSAPAVPADLEKILSEANDETTFQGYAEILSEAYALPQENLGTVAESVDVSSPSLSEAPREETSAAEMSLELDADVQAEVEPDLSAGVFTESAEQEPLIHRESKVIELAALSKQTPSEPNGSTDLPLDPVAREIAEAMQELEAIQGAATPAPSAPVQQAWLANAAPFNREAGKPMIAIVIDDLGMNSAGTRRSITLPPPVTLAFLSYAEGLPGLTERARGLGHELMVHVPMEPLDRANNYPGPEALSVDLTEAELRARLDWALNRFSGFVGINNHMGSRFTSNREGMRIVMERLRQDGLLFLDSVTSQGSVGHEVARNYNVPSVARDIFLDHEQNSDFVWAQLQQVENLARSQGTAIAIGHPHTVTLVALESWISDAKARGFQFVPVTAIVRERERGFALYSGEN